MSKEEQEQIKNSALCVFERDIVCMCVRERDSVCMCAFVRERVCVCVRESVRVCERECACKCECCSKYIVIYVDSTSNVKAQTQYTYIKNLKHSLF